MWRRVYRCYMAHIPDPPSPTFVALCMCVNMIGNSITAAHVEHINQPLSRVGFQPSRHSRVSQRYTPGPGIFQVRVWASLRLCECVPASQLLCRPVYNTHIDMQTLCRLLCVCACVGA